MKSSIKNSRRTKMSIRKGVTLYILACLMTIITISCGGGSGKGDSGVSAICTITYDANGATIGSAPVDSATYVTGTSVTVLGNTGSMFKSGGYAFIGWNTSATASSAAYTAGSAFPMGTQNVTLYAVWKAASGVFAGTVTTFAGMLSDVNGTGLKASFSGPNSVATDGTNLYVSDNYNNEIRKIVIATGVVTTIAGAANSSTDFADGTGTAARFYSPEGIATDGTNLYVADRNNHRIRQIVISTGVVTTLAGSGAYAFVNGTGTGASFYEPSGIVIDSTHTYLYVADCGNHAIRRIVISTGVVTTVAGSGSEGHADATGTSATFKYPEGVTIDSTNTNLYVSDSYNHTIRKIVLSSGVVTTFAGTATIAGHADGIGTSASFNLPEQISSDGTNLYVADFWNNEIRKIVIATGAVTTLAGSTTSGHADGTGSSASFSYPNGVVPDSTGTNLYVADNGNNTIRKIAISSGVVTTMAGVFPDTDGTGTSASFDNPEVIATDGTNLYVADLSNKIRKIVISTGEVTTIAGSGAFGSVNGTGSAASFDYPQGIAIDPAGKNLYVSDTGNDLIRRIVIATGDVTTLAGSGSYGSANGTGTAASFNQPLGLTTDGVNVYVADSNNYRIRKIVIATGEVTTFAGSTQGYNDATGTSALFANPMGITTDGINLYVSDYYRIRKIVISTAVVTTIAGTGTSGSVNGTGTGASFDRLREITTDGINLYAADSSNNMIRKIVISSGVVTTVAGSTTYGSADGTGSAASFYYPTGIVFVPNGNSLYIADTDNNLIRKIQ
jgi:uncharacterized repeat protein (TIGR02543 family)